MRERWRFAPPMILAGGKGWCAYAELLRDGKPVAVREPVSRHGTVSVFHRGATPCEALANARRMVLGA